MTHRQKRVLVTGVTGFVGREARESLQLRGHRVIGTSTRSVPDAVLVADGSKPESWLRVLEDVDAVVHLGGRVHVRDHASPGSLDIYRRANVDVTGALAEAALSLRVDRIVFLSTAGVYGSSREGILDDESEEKPANPYSTSKLEAEEELRSLSAGSATTTVCMRAPIVYGPGAPGSIARLKSLVQRGYPLPFRTVANQRSAISVGNLADALAHVATASRKIGGIYNVSDGSQWSTPELVRLVAISIGREARLLPVPIAFLKRMLQVAGKDSLEDQLLGSLVIDGSRLIAEAGWMVPTSPVDALERGVC